MQHFGDPWTCQPGWRRPDPCVVVTLPGGIELVADPAGERSDYTLTAWDGWRNGPESRGGPVAWESADGGVWGDIHFSGLSLQFEGLILGQSANHYAELEDELGSILTRPRLGNLVVEESHLGLIRQIQVGRGGRPTLTQISDRIGRYSVQVQSASPLKLDIDSQTATIPTAGVTLRNIGNADAHPVVSLVGPLTSPGLSWPGGSWTYRGAVASGQTILVEMERRRVVDLATAVHSRASAQGSWLALPPGDTVVKRTGSGSGTVTAKWRSAWH